MVPIPDVDSAVPRRRHPSECLPCQGVLALGLDPFLFSPLLTPLDFAGQILGAGSAAPGGGTSSRESEHEVQRLSPHSATAILVCFQKRQLNLDEEIFDQCVDTVIALLEEVNDEKFRLTNRKPVTQES